MIRKLSLDPVAISANTTGTLKLHTAGMAVFSLILFLLVFVPRHFPVIWFEDAEDVVYTDKYVEFTATAYKVRECPPYFPDKRRLVRKGRDIEQQIAELRGADGRWRETWMEFVGDDTPDSSRGASWFQRRDFGRWRFYYTARSVKPATDAAMEMISRCGKPDRPPNPIPKVLHFDLTNRAES